MYRYVPMFLLALAAIMLPAAGYADEGGSWSATVGVGYGNRGDDDSGTYRDKDGDRSWAIQPMATVTYAPDPDASVSLNVTGYIDPADTNFKDNSVNEVDVTLSGAFTTFGGVVLTPEIGYWAAGENLTGIDAAIVPALTVSRPFALTDEGDVTLTPAVRAEYIYALGGLDDGTRVYPQATLAWSNSFEVFGMPVSPSVRSGLAFVVGHPFNYDDGFGAFVEPGVGIALTGSLTLSASYKYTVPISGMDDKGAHNTAKIALSYAF